MNSEAEEKYFDDFIDAIQDNNIPQFVSQLKSKLKKDLKDELAWFFLGKSEAELGNLERAKNSFLKAKENGYPQAKVESELESLGVFPNNLKALEENLKNESQLLETSDSSIKTTEEKLKIAKEILGQGKSTEGIGLLKDLHATEPKDLLVIRDLIPALRRGKHFREAFDILERLELDGNSKKPLSWILKQKGEIAAHLMEYQAAAKAYSELIENNKELGLPASNIGYFEFELAKIIGLHLDRPEEAIEICKRAITNNPRHTPAHKLLESLEELVYSGDDIIPIKPASSPDLRLASMANALMDPQLRDDIPKVVELGTELFNEGYREVQFIIRYAEALQRNREYEKAIRVLDEKLAGEIPLDVKAKILHLKTDIYSSDNNYHEASQVLIDLISAKKEIGGSPNSLSHLLNQLATISYKYLGKPEDALEAIREAIRINPDDLVVLRTQKILESRIQAENQAIKFEEPEKEDYISPMLRIDLEEHRYQSSETLANGGKPTKEIALKLFDRAKDGKEQELASRYPEFLEAAKALYDTAEGEEDGKIFRTALARYAMTKGYYLFNQYKKTWSQDKPDLSELEILKDSACNYYIQTLNLQVQTNPRFVLILLGNYLKLQVAQILRKKQYELPEDFFIQKFKFFDVFSFCVQHSDKSLEELAYRSLVSIGAASIKAWNQLGHFKGGPGAVFGPVNDPKKKKHILALVNRIESGTIDINRKPADFFRRTFIQRTERISKLREIGKNIQNESFEPWTFDALYGKWNSLKEFNILFTPTDQGIFEEISKFLRILEPYASRTSDERNTILFDARVAIDDQIEFIDKNTTFWGRVLFYPILNRWKKKLENLERARFDGALPSIDVKLEPNFIQKDEDGYYITLMFKNSGKSTARDLKYEIVLNDFTEEREPLEFSDFLSNELGVGTSHFVDIEIPPEYVDFYSAIKIKITEITFYRDTLLDPSHFHFTAEIEDDSVLEKSEIPWNEIHIPERQMFLGRDKILERLKRHYLSSSRSQSYILYGLTRTGKSSILRYFGEDIELEKLSQGRKEFTILPFSWDLGDAAGAAQSRATDMWAYFLRNTIYKKLLDHKDEIHLPQDLHNLFKKQTFRSKDWFEIVDKLNESSIFPIFMIDELSNLKILFDKDKLQPAFLANIREFALGGKAAFIMAGTYDIKDLIRDPRYSITGQLVNAIEEMVGEISPEDCESLINVIQDKLTFTQEAIKHILFLSSHIPYFIQLICKYCGLYSIETKKKYFGYPEVEWVVKILTGDLESPYSEIRALPENTFQNNQFSPQDSQNVITLLSTICYFNRNSKGNVELPGHVSYSEIQEFWANEKIEGYRPKLAEAIKTLKEKGILKEEIDELGMANYWIGVDLFRRWWGNYRTNIQLELDSLKEDKYR